MTTWGRGEGLGDAGGRGVGQEFQHAPSPRRELCPEAAEFWGRVAGVREAWGQRDTGFFLAVCGAGGPAGLHVGSAWLGLDGLDSQAQHLTSAPHPHLLFFLLETSLISRFFTHLWSYMSSLTLTLSRRYGECVWGGRPGRWERQVSDAVSVLCGVLVKGCFGGSVEHPKEPVTKRTK